MEKNKINHKTIVVIPAYNSEETLPSIYKNIPKKYVDEIIIVDDGSKDKTVEIIKKLGLKPIVHKKNLGYGANQKKLYTLALKKEADYVVMLHPDGQYNPKDLPKFIDALKKGKGDLILGSRFLGTGRNETPFYKTISIKIITLLFNIILGTNISEVNTGYRGYTIKLLKTIPFLKNGNGYIFDPQFIIQTSFFGFKIADVPVSKVYNKEAISPNLSKSLYHGWENIKLLLQYTAHRLGICKISFLIKN